mmetsp:Transcript_125335/g.400713  ORF Transcript_125335/g.400713 Transcript_125335/m.400713 type:complete len:307 (+) Transcript_125335:1042-1962(+)
MHGGNHAEDVGQVDDDDPVLDAAGYHRIAQRIFQSGNDTAHSPLLVPHHVSDALHPDHQTWPALAVAPVPVDPTTPQVVHHVGLGDGQAPHPFLDQRLHHINGLGHVELCCLEHSQGVLLHVLREVTIIPSDATLRQQPVHLAQARVLVLCQGRVQEDLPGPGGQMEHLSLSRLEEHHLRGQQKLVVRLRAVHEAADARHLVWGHLEGGPEVDAALARQRQRVRIEVPSVAVAVRPLLEDPRHVGAEGRASDVVLHAWGQAVVEEELEGAMAVRILDPRPLGVSSVNLLNLAAADRRERDLNLRRI